MAVVAVAPCQCFLPGGQVMTSPGRISLFRLTPALRPAQPGRDDQRLTARVRVPRAACARLEGDTGTAELRRARQLKQRLDAHSAGEILCRPPARRLRPIAFDLHDISPRLIGNAIASILAISTREILAAQGLRKNIGAIR